MCMPHVDSFPSRWALTYICWLSSFLDVRVGHASGLVDAAFFVVVLAPQRPGLLLYTYNQDPTAALAWGRPSQFGS